MLFMLAYIIIVLSAIAVMVIIGNVVIFLCSIAFKVIDIIGDLFREVKSKKEDERKY